MGLTSKSYLSLLIIFVVHTSVKSVAAPVVNVEVKNILIAKNGSSADLKCYGLPNVHVVWHYGQTNISSLANVSCINSSATSVLKVPFTNADDFALSCERVNRSSRTSICRKTFTCVACYNNMTIARVRKDILLSIALDIPSTPLNLSVINIIDKETTLTWFQPPENIKEATVKYYEIQYHVIGNQSSVYKDVISKDKRRKTIRELLPNTMYAVKLRAVSDVGKGFWAETKLRTAKVLSRLISLTFTQVGRTTALLQWASDPSNSDTDTIKYYNILYNPFDLRTPVKQMTMLAIHKGKFAVRFSNLKPNTSYLVKLRAVSFVGKGPWSFRHLTILPFVPPAFVVKPTDQTVVDGSDVILRSKISGFPKPTITWLFLDKPIPWSYTIDDEGSLVLKGVRHGTHNGRYTCVALSEAGKVSFSVMLDVNEACPGSWSTYDSSSSCYLIVNTPTQKWDDARRSCISMGGYLVKISSAEENRYVIDLAASFSSSVYMWIGLSKTNDAFFWTDGSGLSGRYSNWYEGEPNNAKGNEDCAHAYVRGDGVYHWNDHVCNWTDKPFYVCERSKRRRR